MKDKYPSGIYEILNTITGKRYIGSTSNFKKRWNHHKGRLRSNNHDNRYLQSAWNKYTESAFEFNKILICDIKDLMMYEQIFLDHFKSYEQAFGYNLSKTAITNGKIGCATSEETRKKMSESQKGKVRKPHTPEVCKIISETHKGNKYNLGRKASEETKKKMSEASLGRKHTPEAIEKMSASKKGTKPSPQTIEAIKKANTGRPPANKGKPMSAEQKEKLRQKSLGQVHSEESKEKNRIASTGRLHTEETKLKISQKKKGKGLGITPVNKGVSMSEEQKKKISDKLKGNKLSPESIAKRQATNKKKLEQAKLEGTAYGKLKANPVQAAIYQENQRIMFEAQSVLQNTQFNI